MSARWVSMMLAGLSACGPSAAPDDGGTDASPAPIVSVRIEGSEHAFAGTETCFVADFDPGLSNIRLDWNFGDGVREIDAAARACHVYPLVGRRTLGVTLAADEGTAEATHGLSVVFELAELAPERSSPIAVDGGQLFVVNPDADTIAVLTEEPFALVRETPVGRRPRTLAVSGDTIAVACQGDGTLRLLGRDGAERRRVDFGPGTEPYGVVADPRGGGFFVSLLAVGELASVADDGSVRSRIAVGPEPRGLAMVDTGAIVITRWRSDSDGARVYGVDASDPRAPVLTGTSLLPRQEGLDSDTDNNGVLGFLNQAVPSPDGRRAVLPGLKANVVTGTFRTGREHSSQTTARAALGEVLVGAPGARPTDSFRHSFDDLGYASAAVFSPLGDRLFVAFQGAQTVVAVDAFDFFAVGSIDAVGEAPQGLALSADGRILYVQAFLSRSVRAYGVTELSREPPLIGEVVTVAEEPLGPEVLEGKRIFYRSRDPRMSRTRYLSCASCHLDGEGDGLVWDFTQRGEGLRNTIELRGRAGRAPLHWSANFDEVQDFEHDIRGGQGGTGFLPDDVFAADGHDLPLGTPKAGLSPELDALAAYVTSLVDVGRSPFADDASAMARGESLFGTLGCDVCHAGTERTDSAFDASGAPLLHDVGTLRPGSGQRLGGALTGLDTPTLRGLWRTAPYLHDGSAATLRDVLTTANASDEHGVTSGLSDTEVDDLVAFLLALE